MNINKYFFVFICFIAFVGCQRNSYPTRSFLDYKKEKYQEQVVRVYERGEKENRYAYDEGMRDSLYNEFCFLLNFVHDSINDPVIDSV